MLFWLQLPLRRISVVFVGVFFSVNTAKAECHFDHQLVTLSEVNYSLYERLLRTPSILRAIGAEWKDDPARSGMKGFLYFSDNTYVEIWNADRSPLVGYQEACRITDRARYNRLAAGYGKIPVEIPGAFSVFGLYTGVPGQPYGGAGNPYGGLFYIWYPSVPPRSRLTGSVGITRIVKSVPTGAFEELVTEYIKAGISLHWLPGSLEATDSFGLKRSIVRAPFGSPGKLLSVEFTRKGISTLSSPTIQLAPGRGTLFFP